MPLFYRTFLRDSESLNQFFDSIKVSSNDERLTVYNYLRELMIKDKKNEYAKMYSNYGSDNGIEYANHIEFKKALLMFWTGVCGVTSQEYILTIDESLDEFVTCSSYVCFNNLKLPSVAVIKTKQDLYNLLMDTFVSKQHLDFNTA